MQQQAQVTAAKQVEQSKQKAYVWLVTFVMLLIAILTCKLAFAEDVNLFAVHYQQQGSSTLVSLEPSPDTKIFVSKDKTEDNISMLEKGYDMVGSSNFISTDVPPDLALKHGQAIKADTVLVYTQYASSRQKAARIAFLKKKAEESGKTVDEAALEAEEIYDYFASYWVKIPTPRFGVHIVKLKQVMKRDNEVLKKRELKGLRVLAVVQGSAAAKAGIERGDQILQIGHTGINHPRDLVAAVQKFKGQSTEVVVVRKGAKQAVKVDL